MNSIITDRLKAGLRRRGPQAAWLLAAVALAGSADAAKVKGKLTNFHELRNPVWEEAKDPSGHGFSFREPVPTVQAKFRALFPHIPKELCVAAIAETKQKPQPPVLIRIGGGRTTPVTVVYPPGTRLTFKNTDPFPHRLYAVNLKTFSPSDTRKGGTRDWTVPGPGVYEIRDELAPSLRMWVISEPKVATVSYPSMDGKFVLNVREPGEYTIQPYFAGKKVGEPMNVTVKERDIDLTRKPIKVAESAEKKK